MGYKTWQHKEKLLNDINIRKVLFLWVAYLICFVILRNTKVYLTDLMENAQLWEKVIYKIASTICQIGYSSIGICAFYSTAILFTKHYKLKQWYINLGGLCFGVYIFQEFIIKYLYYYTELPSATGFMLLPWITFFITLIMAILLAKISKSL